MPLDGTLTVDTSSAAIADDLATERVVLERAEVLQVMYEVESHDVLSMLPPALHPTDPATATFVWISCTDSPIGSFALAQVRVGCRAGVRPRGFVLRTVINDMQAASMLSRRWGFTCVPGDVELSSRYHEVIGAAALDGRPVLEASLLDPMPLSGTEIQFAASMQPARVGGEPKLVQVDPEMTFHRAARGRPRLIALDAEAWRVARLKPVYPVSAWYAVCDLTMPKVRYVLDPNVTALEGTEKIG